MPMYPTAPSNPTGTTPNSLAKGLACTALQSPTGPQTALALVVSMNVR